RSGPPGPRHPGGGRSAGLPRGGRWRGPHAPDRGARPPPRRGHGAGPVIRVVSAALLVAGVAAGLRWLRVAQREHYLPVVTRFALRWWLTTSVNTALLALAVLSDATAAAWG